MRVVTRAFTTHLLLAGLLGVLLVGCQTLAPGPVDRPAATEPRFLPTLAAPSLPAGTSSTAQQDAFAAAEVLRIRGQQFQARQAFADFVRRYPESDLVGDALLALGSIAATLDQHEQALTYYRAFLDRFPRSGRAAEAHLGLGIAFYYKKDYVSSATALRHHLTLAPHGEARGLAHYYLGAAALKQQRYTEALPELATAQETSRDPEIVQRARSQIGTMVQEALTLQDLVPLAQRYAKTYPGDLLLERLGQEYRKANNQTAEAETLRRLLAAFPQTPGAQAAQIRLRSLSATVPTEQATLGVLLPLSGAGARIGTRALHAIELGLAMAQERYPGLKISLAVRDVAQSTATAQEALRALVRDEHVVGVIGPILSRMATELAPLAGELGVPIVSPYARDSVFPMLSPYALRNSLTDALQGRFLATYAMEVLNLRRFVIVHPEDPYGTALRDQFRAQVLQRQGDIVAVVSYPAKEANLRQLLAPLKDLRYDALFLPEYADKVGAIVTQLAAYRLNKGVQLLGTDGWNAPDLVTRGGALLEGAIFIDSFFANAASPTVQTFVEQFRQRYQESPDLLAAQAYDTFLMCAQVLQAGAQTPRQLRDGLLRIRDFDGVSGRTSMLDTGDADKEPYVLTVQGGRIVQLEGATQR